MPYTPEEVAVLTKYKIMLPEGGLQMVNLRLPLGQPLGRGPLMDQSVIDRLLAADPTPERRWLDWIFFQAGGGEEAKGRTQQRFHEIRDKFIARYTDGFTEGDNDPQPGRHHPGVEPEEAQALWLQNEDRFKKYLAVSDQDVVERLKTFGYFRFWPGFEKRYETVENAMAVYMKFYKKLVALNRAGGNEPIPDNPDDIPNPQAMIHAATRVERTYALKKAPTDIRYEKIYEDPNITALAPFTYAAAVYYGHDKWPWANKKAFDKVIGGGGDPKQWDFQDYWQAIAAKKAVVYLTFKVPVPAWKSRTNEDYDLNDLALTLTNLEADDDPNSWTVYDQENRTSLTIGDVKTMILNEPNRVSPEDEPPLAHVEKVYTTPQEAAAVEQSFSNAVMAVQNWLHDFDMKRIKSNVQTLD